MKCDFIVFLFLLPNITVILQQLCAARSLSNEFVHAIDIGQLWRCCESLQMPPHRNVLPAHSGTRDIMVLIVHAFLVCKNQTMNTACHTVIVWIVCLD
jgi:hypothetical protein